MRAVAAGLILGLASVGASAVCSLGCSQRPEITCRVNDQCFVCPTEQAKVSCHRDPTSSRCKWAEPYRCK